MKTTVQLVEAFTQGCGDEVYISAKQSNWLESLMSKERIGYKANSLRWIPDTHFEYQRQHNGAGLLRRMKVWCK